MIQGLATGYFLWDLVISVANAKLFGPGMLAHAISALVVFSFGFVSASSPKYNMHFADTLICRDHLSTFTVAPLSSMSSRHHS